MDYDLIIIGGGPAGLSAALYASRRSLKTLVLAKSIGGQATYAPEIENYPGIVKISGGQFSGVLYSQVRKFGAEIKNQEVSEIKEDSTGFLVSTKSDQYHADALILAFGKTPRDLSVPGEDKLKGHGVSYCATCDSLFFKDKIVAVIGGGNSAIESAILLAKTSKKVYLIHRRQQFTAESVILDQIKADPKIEIITDMVVKEIVGDSQVTGISLENIVSHKQSLIELQGIFVEIGFVVQADFVKKFVDLDEKDQVIIDAENRTKTAGVFAAGDATIIKHKQIVIAAGEGAKAALSAYEFLSLKAGKKPIYKYE
jgi:thioredoxin reductase (NADPH)